MRGWRSSAVAALWLVSVCGAGWRREELSPERQLPARQHVQLWQGRETRVFHAVVVGPDSVSGVRFQLPPECDSCRVVVARNTVDSMRLGNQERGALKGLAIGAAAVAVVTLVLYFSVDMD